MLTFILALVFSTGWVLALLWLQDELKSGYEPPYLRTGRE